METKYNRIYYLDVLRAIACIFVIMLHISVWYILDDFGSMNFWIGNILQSICTVAVPIFIMISGALLIDEKFQYSKEKLTKYITKMILFFAFWSFVYTAIYKVIMSIFAGGGGYQYL